jgi:Zn-dependent M28 family amino/carboxypeptidase
MKYALLVLLSCATMEAQTPAVEKDAQPGFDAIRADDLKAYLTYLSSDELQGRETSYPGEKKAADYIAAHFKSLGLKPMGDDGSYLQHFDVQVSRMSDQSAINVTAGSGRKTFSWLKDFMGFGSREVSVSGPVACVGFTDNRTPDADRAGLAGKVIMSFMGSRSGGPLPSRRGLLRGARRDSGVVAMLMVSGDSGETSWERMLGLLASAGAARGTMTLKGDSGRAARPGPPTYIVSTALARAILEGSGSTLQELRALASRDSLFAPVTVGGTTVGVNTSVQREERHAENVVGLLEGSDPECRKDVVVFSAHFDHLGVGSDGAIYHGADDDGSGTVMVMELAGAFVRNRVRPKCSLVFLTVAGEEKGLLGSAYYTAHPAIPLDRTVADFNADMIGRMDTTHEREKSPAYSYVIGADKISTELDSLLRVANRESNNIGLDYRYDTDQDPNQFYRRSDHYNFARKGVPIAFFFTGDHADYHKPTDTIDKILFDRMVKIGQVVYYAGWKTANFGRTLTKNGSGQGYRDQPTLSREP